MIELLMRRRGMAEKPVIPVIEFVDDYVKAICVANWGGSTGGSTHISGVANEMTYQQAAAVSSFNATVFNNGSAIKDLSDLRHFTGVSSMPNKFLNNIRSLEKMVFPPNITSITANNYTLADCRNVTYAEFGTQVFTVNRNIIFEYVPPVVIFHTTTPPGLLKHSSYNSYLGRFNNATTKIYVPDSAVDTYKETWTVHANNIYSLNDYEGQTYY